MPSSSPRGKAWIQAQIQRINARTKVQRVLDIGAGEGTYINRYRSMLPGSTWTGIEVWTDYIARFQLDKKYDAIVNQDARSVDYAGLGRQDMVFAGDMLEHMTKAESQDLVDQILDHCRCLFISIPVIYMPQGPHEGNPYEEHVKPDWSDREVRETFKDIIAGAVDQEIGVYLLSRDPDFIDAYQRLKIAIYTIAKNEAQHVARWAASNKEADLRLVCDTGSRDLTINLLKKQDVTVVPIMVDPWRFDVARATALNLLPADIDVCIWQDLDEELLPGWREQLEEHWTADSTTANHRYRNNGRPWQWHSKIHARHGCRWTGSVHETLVWSVPEKEVWIPELYLDEHQDVAKDRKSYLPLLEKKVQEGDRNWRTYYFLANEYEMSGQLQQGLDARRKSYEAVTDGPVVKSYIAMNIARGYARLEDHDQAQRWFQTAADHSPERETLFAWAEFCYGRQDWGACYLAAKKCLAVTDRRDGFTYDERAWSWSAYDIAALAAHNLGIKRDAVAWGEQALAMNPDDQRLQNNLKFYQEAQ